MLLLGLAASCASYRQNIMFQIPEGGKTSPIVETEAKDYLIQKNDLLYIDIYSNNGEKLIDPNPELTDSPVQRNDIGIKMKYSVTTDGKVKLPMVGELSLEGLSLRQAEIAVQKEYTQFFKDPFATIEFANKRAILLGASGGKVIPLANQNMRLTEILALGEGLENNAKAQNIRILRGNETYLIDLSTVDGYQRGNMVIEPGDVIYVEPVRKPVSEAIRDYGTVFSVAIGLASLLVIILNTN